MLCCVYEGLQVSSVGALRRDRDTTFWSFFTDKFGSNPNTPYMWNALPLMGVGLPSPMWSLGEQDAVVMLSRLPVEITLATDNLLENTDGVLRPPLREGRGFGAPHQCSLGTAACYLL